MAQDQGELWENTLLTDSLLWRLSVLSDGSEPSPIPQEYSQSHIFLIFHPSVWLTLPCCCACWSLWTHALNICCLSQSGQGWRHCFSCAHCPGHSLAVCSVFASKFTCREGQLHETRSLCYLPEKLTWQLKPCKSYLINSSGHTPQQCIGAEKRIQRYVWVRTGQLVPQFT